jgi:hypothetical protein
MPTGFRVPRSGIAVIFLLLTLALYHHRQYVREIDEREGRSLFFSALILHLSLRPVNFRVVAKVHGDGSQAKAHCDEQQSKNYGIRQVWTLLDSCCDAI